MGGGPGDLLDLCRRGEGAGPARRSEVEEGPARQVSSPWSRCRKVVMPKETGPGKELELHTGPHRGRGVNYATRSTF